VNVGVIVYVTVCVIERVTEGVNVHDGLGVIDGLNVFVIVHVGDDVQVNELVKVGVNDIVCEAEGV
jgi:hypothetical protein